MNSNLKSKTIVLLGVGHTNAHIVKMWRMKPIHDVRLVCVSDYPRVTYSGMLPGVLSGQYEQEQMEIDLFRLCGSVGSRLIVDQATTIDFESQEIHFCERSPLKYDLLSIGIGSRPVVDDVEIASDANLVAIKPMQTFLGRLDRAIETARAAAGDKTLQVSIVGGGVGGIEVAFCLNRRLENTLGKGKFKISSIHGGTDPGNGLAESTRNKIIGELAAAGIDWLPSTRVTKVLQTELELHSGQFHECHLVLWATNAISSDFLASLELPHDDRGFLYTRATLQSIGNDSVFVVGDSGTLKENSTPKAGVYAVRQGPFLWDNLQRALKGKPLREYRPQKGFLKLLNLGDGRAIGEYKGSSIVGPMMWRLKNHIDVKFMKMYQNYRPMEMDFQMDEETKTSMMRCVGCGGKVGGSVLSKVLKRLDIKSHEEIILGLDQPDDAAIVRADSGQVTLTTDFFAAPFDDPWLVGRMAALNSTSDAFAMGAQPTAALAMIQVPYGKPRRQEEELFELLSGAQHEFEKMGAVLAGGHTIEGPRLTAGFTIAAKQTAEVVTKSGLHPGDELILTKPIGSGVLLAAAMKSLCRGEHFFNLIEQMLMSNQVALDLLAGDTVSSLTDVTGFGLAGHLLEMLRASGVCADIALDEIPLFDGVRELADDFGIESTLAIHNQEVETEMDVNATIQQRAEYKVLFDPQTCGGLLIGVDGSSDHVLSMLHDLGFSDATKIGRVTEECSDDNQQRLRVV